MNKVNLIGSIASDPLTITPKEAKTRRRLVRPSKSKKVIKKTTKKKEIKTIVMCGCGNHPINPRKDPYMQHNKWAAQFHSKMESGRTDIRNIKGIGVSEPVIKPTYDFSGDEFEITPEELRKFNGKK